MTPLLTPPPRHQWLPVFREGRLNTTEACLPVLLESPPPNYPYITPDINLPGVKWVDNHRPLFSVSVTAETSVHAQVRRRGLVVVMYLVVRVESCPSGSLADCQNSIPASVRVLSLVPLQTI